MKTGKAHIRLDADVLQTLKTIQEACPWPVSIAVLGNYVIRHGIGQARKTFNWRRDTGAAKNKP